MSNCTSDHIYITGHAQHGASILDEDQDINKQRSRVIERGEDFHKHDVESHEGVHEAMSGDQVGGDWTDWTDWMDWMVWEWVGQDI